MCVHLVLLQVSCWDPRDRSLAGSLDTAGHCMGEGAALPQVTTIMTAIMTITMAVIMIMAIVMTTIRTV